MKIDLIFPFIDFRKLENNKDDVVIKKPIWPGPIDGFMRCSGMVKPNGASVSYAHKGIKLAGANIPGLKELKRKIEFPFNNEFIGLYSLSFLLKKNVFLYMKPYEIVQFFQNEVLFQVRNLTNSNQDIPIDSIKLKSLSKALKLQYYWASRKLESKQNNLKTKLYTTNNQGKICIDSQKQELKNIKFLRPIFFLETLSYSYEFEKYATYHKSNYGAKLCRREIDGVDVFHMKRKWQIGSPKYREICHFIYAFERNWIFFVALNEILGNLNSRHALLPSALHAFGDNILIHLSKITDGKEFGYFKSFKDFILSDQNNLISSLSAKLNQSSFINETQKSELSKAFSYLSHRSHIKVL